MDRTRPAVLFRGSSCIALFCRQRLVLHRAISVTSIGEYAYRTRERVLKKYVRILSTGMPPAFARQAAFSLRRERCRT